MLLGPTHGLGKRRTSVSDASWYHEQPQSRQCMNNRSPVLDAIDLSACCPNFVGQSDGPQILWLMHRTAVSKGPLSDLPKHES
jgi:hypothetical protein